MKTCENCGLPTNFPNYAYHVCVMPSNPRKKIDALEARIKELEAALREIQEISTEEQDEWHGVEIAYCPNRIVVLRAFEKVASNALLKVTK